MDAHKDSIAVAVVGAAGEERRVRLIRNHPEALPALVRAWIGRGRATS